MSLQIVQAQTAASMSRGADASFATHPDAKSQHAVHQRRPRPSKSRSRSPALVAHRRAMLGWASKCGHAIGHVGLPVGRQRKFVGHLAQLCAGEPPAASSSTDVRYHQPGRRTAASAARTARRRHSAAGEVDFQHFVLTGLTHRQRRWQVDTRARMTARGHDQRHFAAPQQSLPRAQQIEVTNPAQVTFFAKSNAYSSLNHQLKVSRAAEARNAWSSYFPLCLAAVGPRHQSGRSGKIFFNSCRK